MFDGDPGQIYKIGSEIWGSLPKMFGDPMTSKFLARLQAGDFLLKPCTSTLTYLLVKQSVPDSCRRKSSTVEMALSTVRRTSRSCSQSTAAPVLRSSKVKSLQSWIATFTQNAVTVLAAGQSAWLV